MKENERSIHHKLKDQETIVYWVSRHKLSDKQKKTIRVLHGRCQIVWREERFRSKYLDYSDRSEANLARIAKEEETLFITYFLEKTDLGTTAGIYFVSPASWKETILDNYLNRINGTIFGWFIGFGKGDPFNRVEQMLVYRNKLMWNYFPVSKNFGKTAVSQSQIKKHFHK